MSEVVIFPHGGVIWNEHLFFEFFLAYSIIIDRCYQAHQEKVRLLEDHFKDVLTQKLEAGRARCIGITDDIFKIGIGYR